MRYPRHVEVIIGNSTKAIKIEYDGTQENDGLNMKLTVKKSRITYPNLAELDIINLSETTRGLIQNEFTDILINAGYQKDLNQVFIGKIKNLEHLIEGTETITKIYAADGDIDWQKSTVNTTFAGSVSVKDRVTQLAKTFTGGVTVGTLKGLDQPPKSNAPSTISGATKDHLDNLADTYKFDWTVQDQKFETTERNKAINQQTQAVLISASSGMIGSPTVTEIGVNVKAFFNSALLPNRFIVVDADGANIDLGDPYFRPITRKDTVTGAFIINTVTHFITTRGNNATTTIEARRPGTL